MVIYYRTIKNGLDQALFPPWMTFRKFMIAFYIIITRTFNINGVRTLVPVFCLVNHNHDFTAYYTQDEDWSFEVWAAKDIAAGDEITIEYSKLSNAKFLNN